MLDTDVCIEMLRGRAAGLFQWLREKRPEQAGISSITLAELQYGVVRSSRPEHHAVVIAEFCAPLAILPFDEPAAVAYGHVRAALERRGRPIGPLDTLIAAHAIAAGATLITGNLKEFGRVPGLAVARWRDLA